MQLARLYKLSTKGATQIIDMIIEEDTYTRTWGQLDGKMQTKATTAKGKNIGKANETTPAQQAIMEAEAVWAKKQKANYSTSKEAPITVNLPMKVRVYQDHKKKVIFPCYTSVKENGVNAEYHMIDDEVKLLSRGGEEYPIPAHQKDHAKTILNHLGTDSSNGEMYIHGAFLQDIMAATKKTNELTPKLKFNIFDFPTIEGDYTERCKFGYDRLNDGNVDITSFPLINVGVAYSHEDLDEQHKQAVEAGYEGIIIRNGKGAYIYNTRSLDVFKYKVAQDAEFKVTGFSTDKNGHAVFTCDALPITEQIAANDAWGLKPFKVKLKGTNKERLEMAANAATYIGKYLKVEYEMLSKDGIPQKPVGIIFRKVDANGEASE